MYESISNDIVFTYGLTAIGALRKFFDVPLLVAREALAAACNVDVRALHKTRVYRRHLRAAYATIEASHVPTPFYVTLRKDWAANA